MMNVNQPSGLTGYERIQKVLEHNQRGGDLKSEDDEPSLTSAQVAARLTRSGAGWSDRNRNGKTELTYEFSTAQPRQSEEYRADLSKKNVEKIIPLTLRQKEFFRKAQQEYADVANVTFTEKTGSAAGEGHLTYRAYSTGNKAAGGGFAYLPLPGNAEHQGEVWLRHLDRNSKFTTLEGFDEDLVSEESWRSNLIHEMGHGLGLDHPHPEGNEALEPPDYLEDWKNYTVMSYNTPLLNAAEESVHPVSLMIDDMAGIQSKYGANYSTRKGNTVYGFNSNTHRDHYSLKTSQDKPLFAVWDGGGWDTLDFSEFTQDQTINLNEGSLSSVGGLLGNVGIAHGVTIEEARGGKGKNILIGNAAFNVLRGGGNRDLLYGGSGGAQMWGGEGADTFVFDATSSGKPNLVMDFVSGKDKIDLSGMRRQSGPLKLVSRLPLDRTKPQNPNNPTFITQPGDVLVSYDRTGQQTLLRMDTTGDGKMDMQVYVRGKVAREDIVV